MASSKKKGMHQHSQHAHKVRVVRPLSYAFDISRWEGEGGLIRTTNSKLKLKKVHHRSIVDESRWEDEGGFVPHQKHHKKKIEHHHR